jgi:lipopolysaccharide transport system permease protein
MKNKILHIIDSKANSNASLNEIIRYKDLLYFMVFRDFTVMYKQSILGFAWAFINPVFNMLLFTLVFGSLAKVPHDDIPYPIFSYAALIPWTYFSSALTSSSNSLIGNTSIFTKVYFPRLIIPLTPVFSKLVDFSISFILLIILMFYFQYYPTLKLLLLPLLIIILLLATIGMGTFFSSLALQYRDIRFLIGFFTPLLMYAAPVVFPASLVEKNFGHTAYLVYGIYPLTGIIEGFRAAVVTGRQIPWTLIGMSSIGSISLFIVGIHTFRRLESKFADVA